MTGMSRKKSLLFLKQIFVFHLSLSLFRHGLLLSFVREMGRERERETEIMTSLAMKTLQM